MPSKSKAQERLMAAKCHNPGGIKAKGLSKKVACEFHAADKMKKGKKRGR